MLTILLSFIVSDINALVIGGGASPNTCQPCLDAQSQWMSWGAWSTCQRNPYGVDSQTRTRQCSGSGVEEPPMSRDSAKSIESRLQNGINGDHGAVAASHAVVEFNIVARGPNGQSGQLVRCLAETGFRREIAAAVALTTRAPAHRLM
ncbi:unnamed protein product, partial [Mesorhabditis belari]|uniref:Uncharacterized protein n=1 Tax=Mesorhabditis belari TaxID=2138241 RepID=A0AAF3EAW8_9BILA